jgi:hypothetical protein
MVLVDLSLVSILEEAVDFCAENQLPVQFGKKVVVYEQWSFDIDTLGEGGSLIEAVNDAIKKQEKQFDLETQLANSQRQGQDTDVD